VDTHPTDPKLFVTCSYDKSIKIWDLEKKTAVANINYH
jgi:WD40 repeat protein